MTRARRKIFLVDDHPIVIAGLSAAIAATDDLSVEGSVSSPAGALRRLRQSPPPDLTLFDIRLGNQSVFELLQEALAEKPGLPFAMLTASRDWDDLRRAIEMGARGYLLKDELPLRLIESIRRILDGGSAFPETAPAAVARIPERLASGFHTLTDREREVLRYVAQGYQNKEIAHALNISVRTVETHRANISEKLGVNSAVQLASAAIELRDLLNS